MGRRIGLVILFACAVLSCVIIGVTGLDLNDLRPGIGYPPEQHMITIKEGMTKSEVEAILGPGKVDSSAKVEGHSGAVTVWKDGDHVIQIIFKDDKVVFHHWISP